MADWTGLAWPDEHTYGIHAPLIVNWHGRACPVNLSHNKWTDRIIHFRFFPHNFALRYPSLVRSGLAWPGLSNGYKFHIKSYSRSLAPLVRFGCSQLQQRPPVLFIGYKSFIPGDKLACILLIIALRRLVISFK